MAIFTDTVTIYNKQTDGENVTWSRTVLDGVQWADKYEKENNSGRISVARYASLTIPAGKYEGLTLKPGAEEDAVFYGEITETPTDTKGNRISDLLSKYPKSGRIQSVNDNSNRTHLPNIKIVLA